MIRRTFLKSATALTAMTVAGRLYAMPGSGARLLFVFLRGAYDATNIVIPTSSDFYYESRPTIAIGKPGSGADAALPLDSNWSLHPVLKDSIYPLYQNKQIAFVPFCGSDDVSRSHFETQDTIELGQAPQARKFESGFLARLANVLSGVQPMAFTDQLPLIFRGRNALPNFSLKAGPPHKPEERESELIAAMYSGSDLAASVQQSFEVQTEVGKVMADEMAAASRGAVAAQGFALAAKRIALLMRDKFNLGFIDVGGWDTHAGQGGAQGYLASRTAELGHSLSTLASELGPQWNNTVVVVISEFGRTFRENGNRGTDHGHGSVYWVLGGSVRGGRLAGEQLRLTRANLFQDRDYQVLNEYRGMLSGLFKTVYGLNAQQLDSVFPSVAPKSLDLV